MNRGVGRPEQQVRAKHPGDCRASTERRRHIGQDEGEPERYRARRDQRSIGHLAAASVDQDPGCKVGDSVPHRRHHVRRRRHSDREVERVGVIEKQEKHDALPIEIEGEVPEREKQEPKLRRAIDHWHLLGKGDGTGEVIIRHREQQSNSGVDVVLQALLLRTA